MTNVFDSARLVPKFYHPATFLERGVALPFTTPLLSGARARPTGTNQLELIIPSPAGGRGVYIMPWAAIAAFCCPTLHDTIFRERIASLPLVTPLIIRMVGRQVAAEGLAGEDAAESARLAMAADKDDLTLANYQLLIGLQAQVSADPAVIGQADFTGGDDQTEGLRAVVDATGAFLGRSGDWVANALERVAELLAPMGVTEQGAPPRIRRQIRLLAQARRDITDWTRGRHDDIQIAQGRVIYNIAGLTLDLAEETLAAARKMAADTVGLLRSWGNDPSTIGQTLIRPEWLMDGWEQVCLLWNSAADDISRALVLSEIAGLVPIMPKEIVQWGADPAASAERPAWRRRIVPFNEDWLTGSAVFGIVARNERFRAASC